ncbi:MAG: hypothetical protein QOG85_1783 [Gaiellaceae bacterium]|jgi:hypothetical protein|nr:hypothetical protein [Gaiellaceae bacterium]
MAFMDKVRYKLGRWKARTGAYASTIDNDGVRQALAGQSTGSPILKHAAGDAAVQDEHPDKRQHDQFGTDL